MNIRVIVLSLLFLLHLTHANADNPLFDLPLSDKKSFVADTIPLQNVEVVSTIKTAVARNQVPLTISVVDRSAIDESTDTGILSVIADHVPGIFVTEKGVTGYGISDNSAGTVNIHGVGGGNKVLMLFDGQPMWAGIFGHHLPDAYVTSDAERVEVIRGPGSLLYGSSAMGGVINVITRKAGEDGFHGNARSVYGSYNTYKNTLSGAYRNGQLNAYVSVNRDQTDGQRENSEFYVNNGYARVSYTLSKNWLLNGDAIVADFKTNDPGTIDKPMFSHWAKALRTTYSFSVSNYYDRMSGSLQAYYNRGKHTVDDGYAVGETPQPTLFESEDYVMGLALFESFRLMEDNLFTLGVDAKQWGGEAWGTVQPIDKQVTELAGYMVTQQTLFDCLTINGGLRLEHNEVYGSEWVPQAGFAYRISPQTSFKASVSKGFRSPNIREMYMFPPQNPQLKPERMWNYDFSYMQSLWDDRLYFELTAYLAKGSNLITTNGKPYPEVLNVNTGAFTNKGLDVSINYRLSPNLRFNANYSYLHSNVDLTAAPKHKAYAQAHWQLGRFAMIPSLQYVADLYVGKDNTGAKVMENYALLNCKLNYRPSSAVTLFLNGENLTDTDYQTYAGFPMPGLVVLAGVDMKF